MDEIDYNEFQEMFDSMLKGEFWTDGNNYYTIQKIKRPTGAVSFYVVTYPSWVSVDLRFVPWLDWRKQMDGVYMRKCAPPITATDAKTALWKGRRICEADGHKYGDRIYFTVETPTLENEEWVAETIVFSTEDGDELPQIECHVKDFATKFACRHFHVLPKEEEEE